jgi:hypothetical protein
VENKGRNIWIDINEEETNKNSNDAVFNTCRTMPIPLSSHHGS